jgi:hypothetical protein
LKKRLEEERKIRIQAGEKNEEWLKEKVKH